MKSPMTDAAMRVLEIVQTTGGGLGLDLVFRNNRVEMYGLKPPLTLAWYRATHSRTTVTLVATPTHCGPRDEFQRLSGEIDEPCPRVPRAAP